MKLIFCTVCQDIVRLHAHPRACECGKCWGYYLEDHLRAVIGGPVIPLGFRNDEFKRALISRPAAGMGSHFASFIIPEVCDTVALECKPIRTSASDPLRIATLDVPNGGAVGITFAPGKRQRDAMSGGTWIRNLEADLMAISSWGAHMLVTLLEPHELVELGIPELASHAAAVGIDWYGLPITDGAAPDKRFLDPWMSLGPQFIRALRAGQRTVVHCKGGLGRAGTVACLLLHGLGLAVDADQAMAMVRAVRPRAIETSVQEHFIRAWFELNPDLDEIGAHLADLKREAEEVGIDAQARMAEESERRSAKFQAELAAALHAKGVDWML